MNKHRVNTLVALVLASVSALPAQSQGTVVLPIADAKARQAVEREIAQAAAKGLPTQPLISKAMEGVTKAPERVRRITLAQFVSSGGLVLRPVSALGAVQYRTCREYRRGGHEDELVDREVDECGWQAARLESEQETRHSHNADGRAENE